MHTELNRCRPFALAAIILLAATAARAATYTVSSLADNLAVDAQCTLREAVAAHNAAVGANDCGVFDAAADTINFSVTGTILLNSGFGELTLVAPDLTIQGPGASLLTLDGQDAMSVLVLNPAQPPNLTVRGLTVQNGLAFLPVSNPEGGAIRGTLIGGSPTTITVEDTILVDNASQPGGGGNRGGAIASFGTLVIRRSFLARNTSQFGSAILHSGDLTIEDSEFTQHTGASAIQSIGSLGVAQWVIRRSLFRMNQTTPSVVEIQLENGVILIENSTFQGNVPMVLTVGERGADVTVRNSTFAGNVGTFGVGQAVVVLSGLLTTNPARLHVESSLFAANAAPAVNDAGPPGTGVVTTAFNLFDTPAGSLPPGTVCAGSTAGSANLCGVAAPGLNPLGSNGGPTQTMSLVPGSSPALHAGSNPGALSTDQRGVGFNRVVGPAADIGAFESQTDPVELLSFEVE